MELLISVSHEMLFNQEKHRHEVCDGNSESVLNTMRIVSSTKAYKYLIASNDLKNAKQEAKTKEWDVKPNMTVNIFF
jgi:hypothetical protein